jgi:hypothetical protein
MKQMYGCAPRSLTKLSHSIPFELNKTGLNLVKPKKFPSICGERTSLDVVKICQMIYQVLHQVCYLSSEARWSEKSP